eukprot:scaffold1239_cov175-Pinguiococcus_pyrenoidosus.AAC.4
MRTKLISSEEITSRVLSSSRSSKERSNTHQAKTECSVAGGVPVLAALEPASGWHSFGRAKRHPTDQVAEARTTPSPRRATQRHHVPRGLSRRRHEVVDGFHFRQTVLRQQKHSRKLHCAEKVSTRKAGKQCASSSAGVELPDRLVDLLPREPILDESDASVEGIHARKLGEVRPRRLIPRQAFVLLRQVPKEQVPSDCDVAVHRHEVSRQRPEQGALANSVVPHNRNPLTKVNPQRDRRQGQPSTAVSDSN